MADEKPDAKPKKPSDIITPDGPGANPVGLGGIIALAAYLVVLSVALLHGTIQLWNAKPVPAISQQAGSTVSDVAGAANEEDAKKEDPSAKEVELKFWIFGKFTMSEEAHLILMIILLGALGSIVHALRSLFWYVGNRQLVSSWIAMYGLLPFVGSALSLLFYLVIRGGFFSPQSSSEQISRFGFAALAGLVGMFSEQTVLKLKSIAESLFAKGEKGEDHVEPKEDGPEGE